MYRKPGFEGVSTALATIAIILVLILGMSWMAYTVVLNARQQAEMAGRAETVALKAKELIRVYVWLDPARQPDGRHLNLTRISFVGAWSGETMINGLLIAYNDGGVEVRDVSIKIGAGEDKTYLPSELGLAGLDNFQAFRSRVKYVQAHTSLGNDFISLWGRPDKPALYVTGTTRTDTYTTTSTTTTQVPTTTTRSRTTTSYTTTATSTTSVPPPPGTPIGRVHCYPVDYGVFFIEVSFNPNGWGTPLYTIILEYKWVNYWGTVGRVDVSTYYTNGGWSLNTGAVGQPPDYFNLRITLTAVDAYGRAAEWRGGCNNLEPPPTYSTTSYSYSTGPPQTTAQEPVVVLTTVTSTTTTFIYQNPVATTTVTSTYWRTIPTTTTVWITTTTTVWDTVTVTQTHTMPFVSTVMVTQRMRAEQWAAINAGPKASCPLPELVAVTPATPAGVGWRALAESMAAVAAASVVWRVRGRRLLETAALVAVAAALLWAAQPPAASQYGAEGLSLQTHSTTTITYVSWVTVTQTVTQGGTVTQVVTVTSTTTVTFTETFHQGGVTTTITTTITTGTTVWTAISTTTITVHPCVCMDPAMCIWTC